MTTPPEVAELIAAAESYQKAHLKVSDLKEFGGPEYMYGSEWREATCAESNEYCRLTNVVRACKESALQQQADHECRAHKCKRIRVEMQAEIDRLRGQQAEPVAWEWRSKGTEDWFPCPTHRHYLEFKESPSAFETRALYTRPAQPAAVPVESLGRDADELDEYVDGYEYRGETEDGRDACYTPNERERLLIKDALLGWEDRGQPTAPPAPVVPDLSRLERVFAGASIDNEKSPSEHKAGFVAGLSEAIRILRLPDSA